MKKEQTKPIHDLRDAPVPEVRGSSSDTGDILLQKPRPEENMRT